MVDLQASSSANRLLVLYQYIRPIARPHRNVVLFQLLDFLAGGAVEI